jgi:uncharacterized membrane protein
LRTILVVLTLIGLHASIAAGWVVVAFAVIVAVSALALGAALQRKSGPVAIAMLAGNVMFFSVALALYAAGTKVVGHILTLPSFLILAGLSFVFAQSLARGEEPIVNRFMRMELGSVPERAARYGRRLTAIWAVLLAAMAVESMILSFAVDLSTWSWLVNVVNPVALAIFFVAQHLYGDRFLPEHRRASPLTTVKAMLHPGVWFGMRAEQPRREH